MGRIDANNNDDYSRDGTTSDSSDLSVSQQVVKASTDGESDSEQSGKVREAGRDPTDGGKLVVRVGEEVEQGATPTSLGATRYVMAGFFAVGIAVAYVCGEIVVSIWHKLASIQSVIDVVPWLTFGGEEARESWGLGFGAVVGILLLVYAYRRNDVRTFVDESASELSKVTWPNKKEVTNGTVVVVVASLIAMVYLMLLDRFWGFVTDLVYGA